MKVRPGTLLRIHDHGKNPSFYVILVRQDEHDNWLHYFSDGEISWAPVPTHFPCNSVGTTTEVVCL